MPLMDAFAKSFSAAAAPPARRISPALPLPRRGRAAALTGARATSDYGDHRDFLTLTTTSKLATHMFLSF